MRCDRFFRPRPLLACALAGLLSSGTTGCGGGAAAAGGGQKTSPDPLAEAPQDWDAFLAWAEKKLQSSPDPVPLPQNPALPRPRWPVLRLDAPTRLEAAQKRCAWQRRETPVEPLAEVRDVRSTQPRPPVEVRRMPKATPDGKDALAVVMRGFRVSREEVGALELDVHIPFGTYFVLRWGKAGEIMVPLKSHAPFQLTIPTDEFAEWEGPLGEITLLSDGLRDGDGEREIQVRSLKFLPRTSAYPDPVGLARVKLGDEIRTALYAHAPAEITYERLSLPKNAKLSVGLGAIGAGVRPRPAGGGEGDPWLREESLTFQVIVEHGGTQTTVLERAVAPGARWVAGSASLAGWGGQRVSLTLRMSGGDRETVGLWGNPTIYAPVESPPVLVLYLIDTVCAEHLDLYGYERATMPRLTELAGRGVWFAQMFSNSSRTIESIPNLMLSLHTEQHGVYDNLTPAPQALVTLAEVLRAAGFATVSFCTNVNAGPRQGMDQGFDCFFDKIGYHWTDFDRTVPLEDAAAWIDAHRDRPMFLYVHTAEPHAPYTPPPGFAGRFDPDYTGGVDGTYDRQRGFHARVRNRSAQTRDLQHVVALYDEEILYADTRLGMFLDLLAQRGLLERADVLVTSDHGEEFLEHGMWEHGLNLHNEQTRPPLVASGPNVAARGRVDTPVQIIDLMPTVLDLYGLPSPYELEGKSLLPLLRGSAAPQPPKVALASLAGAARNAGGAANALRERRLFGSNHNYRARDNLIEYYAIEEGRWKLIYGWRPQPTGQGKTSRFVLYDIQKDPREQSNLLTRQVDVARRLIGELVRWRLSRRPYDHGQQQASFTMDAARDLLQLGYMGQPHEEAQPDGP